MALLDVSDKYLVIGQRLDMQQRRAIYTCEQIVPTTVVITHPTGTGFEIPNLEEPNLLVFDERWEPAYLEPNTLVFDEPWEAGFVDPGTLDFDERWEA